MNALDILKKHDDTSCILLYGNTSDLVLSKDLCFREFRVALADILHETGYDNVVFYDSTNASGKFVYDDASAYYTGIAREEYVQKHGSTPSKTAPKTNPNNTGKKNTGIKQFGMPRKKVSQPVSNDPPQNTPQADPVPQTTMRYQQRNMDEVVFHGELETYMKNDTYRSAVILTDINNFLRNSVVRDKFSEDIRNNWNKKNLLIFIHPDLSSAQNKEFFQLLRSIGLLEYFYDKGNKCEEDYTPKKTRVFKIEHFFEDEITYLMKLSQIQYGFHYTEGISKTAEKIHYIIKSQKESEQISMRMLKNRMQRYALDHVGADIGDKDVEKILGYHLQDIDFNPWETLRNRRGWENIVVTLESFLKTQTSEQEEKDSVPSEKTLFVKRMGGRDNRAEHYPGSNKLPHIMLEGSPGTGKTTSIKQIGRILHDEGFLATGHVISASRSDLIGDVIGATSIKVREMVAKAEGGVLFIDEAHQLCENNNDRGNGGIYAKEAVGQLVKCMTDESTNVLFVFAGYRSTKGFKDGVRGLFDMDQGLEDRIKIKITIPDYTPEILEDIFFSTLHKKGYQLGTDLTKDDIHIFMTNIYQTRNRRTFSNGRYVTEVLIENRLIKHAVSRGDSSFILKEDFGELQPKFEPVTLEKVKEEFENMPGLGDIGISIAEKYINFRQMKIDDGVSLDKIPGCKHMILVGNPGTGKTTLVNMLCRAFGSANIMSGLDAVIVDTPIGLRVDDLKVKIKEAVNSNTILFIDEAHDSSEEILKSLLHEMSENKELTCAFAVYPNRLTEFLQKARGFRDRCDKPYILPDYTPEQMYEIFSEECASEENRCICTDELSEQLKVLFRNWYHTKDADEDFSNARQIISLFEETKANHYTRIGRDAYKAETVHELSVLDIPDEYSGIIETQSGNRTFEDVMAEINKYYGWSELKEWLENKYKLLKLKKNGMNLPVPMGHMCFIGGPGTGKSTSGALFAEACYAMGLTSTSKFTKYLAKDLIAGFKGQTAQKIADAMEAGKKGVILIDEAYALTPDPLSGNNDFETAAVDYLLDFTEVNQKDTIVILAGYEDKIKQLLASNRGLNDRFPTKIIFPNFSPAECTQILNSMLEKYIKVSEECISIETQMFETVCILPEFANARTVRNIQNEIFNAFSDRMTKLLDTADMKDGISQIQTLPESMILPEDIQNGFSNWHKSRK